jgi:hypothetical protein
VSDLTADDYARLATEIGMVASRPVDGAYTDPTQPKGWHVFDLPGYLAEPAQMVRILALPMRGDLWEIEPDGARWAVSRVAWDDYEPSITDSGFAQTIGEAVRDCAARALRP